MSHRPATFRQRDVTAAVKAAIAAGLDIARVEIDKTGKIMRPILMARPKQIGEIIAKRNRQALKDLYAGMDPTTKQFNSKYVKTQPTISSGDTAGAFSFAKIKV